MINFIGIIIFNQNMEKSNNDYILSEGLQSSPRPGGGGHRKNTFSFFDGEAHQ